ncbi:MAG: hypothetical protein LBD64_02090 [Odoribacteraceae bacterium]|nr:hypothetical protein [Odoribacteraceae bacterium]
MNTFSRIVLHHAKLARRSNVTRIFVLFTLSLLLFIELTHVKDASPGANIFLQLSSFIPYVSAYIVSLFIFFPVILLVGNVATGRVPGDTRDAIYYRPASNAGHVWGAAAGIARVFAGMSVFLIHAGIFIHISLGSDAPFNAWLYIFYLATMVLPLLVFAIGISFAVFALLRHRALALLLLLAYAGVTFFLVGDAADGLFDPAGFALPNAFSDVTGHPGTGRYLLQRSCWLLLGLGLIQVAAARFHRLPNQPAARGKILPAVALIAAGIVAGGAFYLSHRQDRVERRALAACYNAYRQAPKMTLVDQAIDYRQEGDKMFLSSRLVLENRTGEALDEIILYLNPGLRVTSLREDDGAMEHARDRQVIRVATTVAAGESRAITLDCEGYIDERVCFLDIPDALYRDDSPESAFNCRFGKRYAILSAGYVWLTPECLWYPVAVPPSNPVIPYDLERNFSHYALRVIRPAGKTVISQGKREGQDTITFRPEQPLKGIALCIGDYERRSVTIDSTLLELYFFKGHESLTRGLEDLADTLSPIFAAFKRGIGQAASRDYPFHRFALVERPLPVASYYRQWRGGSDLVQPEMLFFPERGARVCPDFKRARRLVTEETSGSDWAYSFLSKVLATVIEQQEESFIAPTDLFSVIARHTLGEAAPRPAPNLHEITSLFHDHAGALRSADFPVLDAAFHALLKKRGATLSRLIMARFSGQEDPLAAKAEAYLDGHSLKEAVEDNTLDPLTRAGIFELKAGELTRLLVPDGIGSDDLLDFAARYMEEHPFQEISFEHFNNAFVGHFGAGWMDALPGWYAGNAIPAYLVEAPVSWSDDEQASWIAFAVYNDSDADGIVTIETLAVTGQASIVIMKIPTERVIIGGEKQESNRDFLVPARTGKRVAFKMDLKPMFLSLNTNIARNSPSRVTSKPAQGPATEREEERPVDRDYFFTPGEIIVDNVDPGFSISRPSRVVNARDWLRGKEKTDVPGVSTRGWTTFPGANAYGLVTRDDVRKLAGNGKHSVCWRTRVAEEGTYEVSAYIASSSLFIPKTADEVQHYVVSTADGPADVTAKIAANAWVTLGRFRLSPGECTVALDDRGANGQVIIADAIKWTLVE